MICHRQEKCAARNSAFGSRLASSRPALLRVGTDRDGYRDGPKLKQKKPPWREITGLSLMSEIAEPDKPNPAKKGVHKY